MTDYQKYINALRKCAREHENDRTPTGHIIVSNLCKDTANLLEELEQEPILDKIYDEVSHLVFRPYEGRDTLDRKDVLQIIDKYKSESEK